MKYYFIFLEDVFACRGIGKTIIKNNKFYKNNFYKIMKIENMFRYDREFLERFCKDNDITNITYENIDESVKVTRETHVKGQCKGENCHEKFDKTLRQVVENSGPYCKKCSLQNGKNKSKQTCLEKYGVENPFQSQEVKDKCKQTCLEKYGVGFYGVYYNEAKMELSGIPPPIEEDE